MIPNQIYKKPVKRLSQTKRIELSQFIRMTNSYRDMAYPNFSDVFDIHTEASPYHIGENHLWLIK